MQVDHRHPRCQASKEGAVVVSAGSGQAEYVQYGQSPVMPQERQRCRPPLSEALATCIVYLTSSTCTLDM